MTEKLKRYHSAVAAIISPVYAVGGCVRDALRGAPCKDYDFATPLSPDEIEAAVRNAGRHPYLVGKRFGTVGLKVDGTLIEVTTFRIESYEKGSRHPQVEFIKDLTFDLSRRDFTMNAIAYDGDFIDPFDGRADIEARIVRAVGDPAKRMREDPLRMLRAARFQSVLGFSIEESLEAALRQERIHLASVSRERWSSEMDRLLLGADAAGALDTLQRTGVLRLVVPELAGFPFTHEDGSLTTATGPTHPWKQVLENVTAAPADEDERWAALLSHSGLVTGATDSDEVTLISAEIATRTAAGLRWSKARFAAVHSLILGDLDPQMHR